MFSDLFAKRFKYQPDLLPRCLIRLNWPTHSDNPPVDSFLFSIHIIVWVCYLWTLAIIFRKLTPSFIFFFIFYLLVDNYHLNANSDGGHKSCGVYSTSYGKYPLGVASQGGPRGLLYKAYLSLHSSWLPTEIDDKTVFPRIPHNLDEKSR